MTSVPLLTVRGLRVDYTTPKGTNAACSVSSVASSERPPTYKTRLSCWGGMVLLVRRRRARVIDATRAGRLLCAAASAAAALLLSVAT